MTSPLTAEDIRRNADHVRAIAEGLADDFVDAVPPEHRRRLEPIIRAKVAGIVTDFDRDIAAVLDRAN